MTNTETDYAANHRNHELALETMRQTGDTVREVINRYNVATGDIPGLVASIHGAYVAAAGVTSDASAVPLGPVYEPAVTIKKSLASREHIISMIDGKPYKMLRRHLATRGLEPEGYRERYGLPADYPMVAPAYAEIRRDLAKSIGLGRNGGGRSKAK